MLQIATPWQGPVQDINLNDHLLILTTGRSALTNIAIPVPLHDNVINTLKCRLHSEQSAHKSCLLLDHVIG